MASVENIVESITGNIKIIRYNNPRRLNAINIDMYQKLTKILNETAMNDDIVVTVLTGTGAYYSSGNDMKSTVASVSRNNFATILKDFINAFINFPKILVAIVNGPAIGIAATTLPLCDLVFAAENAFFQTPFTRLGIVPEGCSTYTFPRLMGERMAAEMLLFNRRMTAQEALECGFVNDIFKPEELQTKVWDKINEVATLNQNSVVASKRLLRKNLNELLQTNKKEMDELELIWSSGDYIQTVQEFLERKSKL